MLCELSELLFCQIKQIERKLYLGVCLVLWGFGGWSFLFVCFF